MCMDVISSVIIAAVFNFDACTLLCDPSVWISCRKSIQKFQNVIHEYLDCYSNNMVEQYYTVYIFQAVYYYHKVRYIVPCI